MLTALQGISLQSCLDLGTDPPVDLPHRIPPVQWGLEYVGIYNAYESRVFLRVSGEYFASYPYFSLNMSFSPPPFLLTFWLRYDMFLGGLYIHYRLFKLFA